MVAIKGLYAVRSPLTVLKWCYPKGNGMTIAKWCRPSSRSPILSLRLHPHNWESPNAAYPELRPYLLFHTSYPRRRVCGINQQSETCRTVFSIECLFIQVISLTNKDVKGEAFDTSSMFAIVNLRTMRVVSWLAATCWNSSFYSVRLCEGLSRYSVHEWHILESRFRDEHVRTSVCIGCWLFGVGNAVSPSSSIYQRA